MEKIISLQSKASGRRNMLSSMLSSLVSGLRKPLEMTRRYYSDVLERELDLRQTFHLLNAQCAFFFGVFPVEAPVMLRVACAAWLLHALYTCHESLKR